MKCRKIKTRGKNEHGQQAGCLVQHQEIQQDSIKPGNSDTEICPKFSGTDGNPPVIALRII